MAQPRVAELRFRLHGNDAMRIGFIVFIVDTGSAQSPDVGGDVIGTLAIEHGQRSGSQSQNLRKQLNKGAQP